MKILSWGMTDVGRKRDHNEDNYGCFDDMKLYVVADGMGGHAAGEMASSIAVRTIEQRMIAGRDVIDPNAVYGGPIEESPVPKLLADAVREACSEIFRKAQTAREYGGMGTTTTALLFHGKHAFVAHVGDSRAYLLRHGKILQLSEDHSLVNEQLRAGIITEAQARTSRFKNIITRSVGVEEDVAVDLVAVETQQHDTYVLCSDGLANLVNDLEIGETVTENFFRQAPELLVDMANGRGGDDNITVVVAYVQEM
ncbi:MAG: Stp1/IreP family PP2C-type Ser/Thr phosphatase [Deltaproteobacteria bacterium]|nr:Stp1/IreP family PP2C-type Ser/Thr phosphatase [Deltaproteobacteria bacterium]